MTGQLQTQQQLFPLDPWGCEGVFAVVDLPHPTIARAIVGPLLLGQAGYSFPQMLRCIAVHSGRHFLFSAQIPSSLLVNPEKFWATAAGQFGAASLCSVDDQMAPLAVTPEDSVQRWSGSAFWMPEAINGQHLHKAVYVLSKFLARHDVDGGMCGEVVHPLRYEHLARVQVNVQLIAALQHLLRATVPELHAAYTKRPRLSTAMVNQLLVLAQGHGVLATKYTLQAIQTESFGLLHLMAFNDGGPDAQEIRQVIFNGGSLPAKVNELGVPKGVYRRTLFKSENSAQQKPLQPLDISSLHMPGVQWLAAMRLTKNKPVYSLGDWQALGRMLEQLQLLALSDQSLNSAVMACCVKDGYIRCGTVLERLCRNARALMKGAQHIALVRLSFERAIGIVVEWETHLPVTPVSLDFIGWEQDWIDPAACISVVCQVFGLDVHDVMQSTLDAHPGLPAGFSNSTELLLLPLDSMALTFLHGNQVGNCLHNFHSAVTYIADGVALYGVQDSGVAIGTIALKRDADEQYPKVEVLELSGRNNERAGYQLGHLAYALATKWNADSESEAWTRFSTHCRRLSPVG